MPYQRWVIKEPVSREWLQKFPELNPIIAQLLYYRGITTQEEVERFLKPDYSRDVHDPFLFLHMEKAVERIWKAVEEKERIVVYGDYDADGISSTAMLVDFLNRQEAVVDVYLPHRSKEGYGLSAQTVPEVLKLRPRLVITLDCGSTNADEIALLNKEGIDTIVVDHHLEPEVLPAAYAILNCSFSKEKYPFKLLAAGGMTYKLIQGLIGYQRRRDSAPWPEGFEKWYLDLAAIATIADIVPLVGENRTLVAYGLIVLNKTKRMGLKALMRLAGLELGTVTEGHVGFVIGPRLNAAGRINHASQAYDLLMCDDAKKVDELARSIHETNSERQSITEAYTKEAKQQVHEALARQDKMLFAFSPSWNLGVVGLVAGKLMDEFHRPVIAMTEVNGTIKGSGRSIKEFHITKALGKVSSYLSRFGGHAQACGFTLKSKDVMEKFTAELLALANDAVSDEYLLPGMSIDADIPLSAVDWDLEKDLEKLSPFGKDAPKPRFVSHGLSVMGIEYVGLEQKHVRINVSDEKGNMRKTIAFGMGGQWGEKLQFGDKIDIVYEIDVNEWNGNRELQLKVVDMRLSEEMKDS